MDISTMNLEQLREYRGRLAEELIGNVTADRINEINGLLDQIEEREAQLKALNETRARAAAAVAAGEGTTVGAPTPTTETRSNREIRNSQEYIEAFAEYIRTGDATECRSILTENVTGGVVPVPELVESRVRQAWENDEIFSRVSRTFVRGNLKVGFEVSATDAAVHTEGDKTGPAEEVLTLGIVTMVPANIKKWITVSDEVLALGAEEFLAYIYDELTYKIIRKAADLVVAAITNAPATSDAKHVGVAQITGPVSAATIIDAVAALGDSARDNVLIASGATIAAVRKAALTASYAFDPFDGLTVIKKDGVTGAIVGDLSGVQVNMPEGDAVTFKFDDLSMAEHDLVKIVGRLYAAIAVVGPKMFAYITGTPASE